MTPTERAKELVDTYFKNLPLELEEAKECALIAVKEINDYWKEVEQEINKM